jgi:hypothetical protein
MFSTPVVNLNDEENIKDKEDEFLHSLTDYFT